MVLRWTFSLAAALLCAANLGCCAMNRCGDGVAGCGCPEASCGCDDYPSCGCPDASCGCADVGCDASCGCPEASCAAPGGCGGAVGCGSRCSQSCCPLFNCPLFKGLFGCAGCSNELYWSEWHNDPPCACDPCDCYGNYVGRGSGGNYEAPYRRPMNQGYAQSQRNTNRVEPRAEQEVAGIPQPPRY